jgi:hypothetical protein
MFKTTPQLLAGAMFGLATGLAAQDVQAQFQPPVNSLALNEEGTLEGMQGNILKFRDSKQEVWLLQVSPQSTVSIVGEADVSYLRPGLTVELTGKIDEEATIADPIAEIEVVNSKGRQPMGLFAVDETDEDAKPVRSPTPGEYRVRGRITSVKDGALEIAAGRLKISATAAEDLKVILAVDDPRLAQFGDKTKVKAWYIDGGKPNPLVNTPGKAVAEEVNITLTNPPPSGKRGR